MNLINLICLLQNAERKLQGHVGGGGDGLTDSEHSDSDSSEEEEDEDEEGDHGRVIDSSDDEEQSRRCRVSARRSTHEYQNVSQLEWDNSTM